MPSLEERLAKLEREVEELKLASTHVDASTKKLNWISKISGSFRDDPEFEEILRLGREERKAEMLDDK